MTIAQRAELDLAQFLAAGYPGEAAGVAALVQRGGFQELPGALGGAGVIAAPAGGHGMGAGFEGSDGEEFLARLFVRGYRVLGAAGAVVVRTEGVPGAVKVVDFVDLLLQVLQHAAQRRVFGCEVVFRLPDAREVVVAVVSVLELDGEVAEGLFDDVLRDARQPVHDVVHSRHLVLVLVRRFGQLHW